MAEAKALDPDRAHPQRVQFLLVLLPFLCILGLGIGLAAGVRGIDIIQLALALLTTAVALLPLVLDQGRRASERHVLLATFSIVFIIGFALPVVVIFMPADGPIEAPSFSWSNLFPVDIVRGQLATLLGLFCLLIGYAIPVGKGLARSLPRFRRDWPPGVAVAVALIIIPLGWAVMLSGLAGFKTAALGSGFVSVLASAYLYGIALLTIVYARHHSRFAVLVLAITVPMTSLFGFFTGSKEAVLIPWAMIALAIILVRRRIGVRWIALGILASTLVFPVTRFVRDDILEHNTLSPVVALANPIGTLSRVSAFVAGAQAGEYFVDGLLYVVARMDCIGPASVLIRDTPRVAPFQYGRTLGLFFVAFVPRIIWPEKPTINIGRYITDAYGSGPEIATSTAPTQLGELFMNFGYAGIIGGMLLYGLILRVAHELLLRESPTTPALFVAVVVLYRLGLGFQGDTANTWAVMVMAIVPILAAHVAVRLLFPAPRERRVPGFGAGSDAVAER